MKQIDDAKVALIYEDKIEYLGNNKDSEEMHNMCLLDYAKTHFPLDPIFSKLNIRHRPETISYFYTLKGISVFLNITNYDENNIKKYGKTGILLVPNEVSKDQIISLKKFSKEISDFDLMIINDSKLVDGMLEHKTLRGFNNETPEELLSTLYKEQETIKTK